MKYAILFLLFFTLLFSILFMLVTRAALAELGYLWMERKARRYGPRAGSCDFD